MLKIRKSKVKVVGAITLLSLLSISYVGLSFYSIPEKVSAITIEDNRTLSNISTMQQMTAEVCENSEPFESKSLRDVRDSKYYVITKLDDNRCWMTENLALEMNNMMLTPTDSDVPYSWRSTTGASTTNWSSEGCTYPDNPSPCNIARYYNGSGSQYWKPDYGYYYSWSAATAGMGTSISGDNDATRSICAKGWRLPSVDDYRKLYTSINVSSASSAYFKLISSPYNFKVVGQMNANGEDTYLSRFWSRTSYKNSIGAYFLQMEANNRYVAEVTAAHRGDGNLVRCINDLETHQLTPIDEWDSQVAVSVGPTISIDAVTSLKGAVDYTTVLEKTISATISANNDYKVLLSADETSLKDANQPEFAGIPTAEVVEAGTSAWGVYAGTTGSDGKKIYDKMTTYPSTYYNTTSSADGKATTYTYGIGISVSPSVPNGTYSTVVTVTAANA